MLRLSSIRIGTKLAIMSGIAVLLVAGLAIEQRLSDNSVSAQNGVQDQAISVRSNLKDAQSAILRTWVARRDALLAKTGAAVDKALGTLHENTTIGQGKIDGASAASVTAEDLARLKELKSVFAEYIASTESQLSAHKDVLTLRTRQIDALPAWTSSG